MGPGRSPSKCLHGPSDKCSQATSRSPAGLSGYSRVAGRALEDSVTELLWQPGTCQVAEWPTGFSGRNMAFLMSVDISRFRCD